MTKPTTVIVKKQTPIEREEGSTNAIELTVPQVISMTGLSAHMKVIRPKTAEVILEKTNWNIDGQEIWVALSESDTLGKAGNHRYELIVYNASDKRQTIMRGPFTIRPTLIKTPKH